MTEEEPNKVGVKIFETTHIALSKEKNRRREEEKSKVDFADLIQEATDKLLGTEHKTEWPISDRVWHEMLAAILGSLREFNVPEKTALEAIKAVKANLRVFYRHIGRDPDEVQVEKGKRRA